MTLETLLVLRQALVAQVREGFDISSPDAAKVWGAKVELDVAIAAAEAPALYPATNGQLPASELVP